MCVKLIPGDLNPDLYPSYPTSTCICKVTTAQRVRGGKDLNFIKLKIK